MGQIKEVWAKQARKIEKKMDEITAEYDKILSIDDYFDHLYDFFSLALLLEFEAVIVEYQNELKWKSDILGRK